MMLAFSRPWSAEIRARLDRVDAGIAETFPVRRSVVASTRQPAVTRELEYLREALERAETSARWYAERSPAAAAFSEEIDAAESTIARLPNASPRFDHGTRRYLPRRFTLSIVYRVEPRRILAAVAPESARLLDVA
jgi:hypothetical protein